MIDVSFIFSLLGARGGGLFIKRSTPADSWDSKGPETLGGMKEPLQD